ncbi:MAG: isoprenylcysteine carboxylmethyltransferase family protein [Gemmatimonadota bacterium]|nr:MAG: isoprenylcysteine carboxylmethyltransferase family protein [Gemmatimonadota bacterium]
MDGDHPSRRALIAEAAIRIILSLPLLALMLFLPAGRWDWTMGWALIAVMLVLVCVNMTVLLVKNPEVIRERMRGGKGVRKWDRLVTGSMAPFALAVVLLGGFDQRFGWSPPFAPWIQVTALGLLVVGDLIFLWAMAENKFFTKMVRIQRERGHYVVTGGPYRYVRHPGYVGWYIMMIGLTVALGSLWGFIPAVILLALMLVRTALEDRTLRKELAGYEEYAERVRYRLIPGAW